MLESSELVKMSRLADPHFEEIYAICNDITENSCEDDPLLESDVHGVKVQDVAGLDKQDQC